MRCSRDLLQQVSSTGCSKLVCETEHGEGACVCLFKMEATEENKRGSTPIIKLTRQKKKKAKTDFFQAYQLQDPPLPAEEMRNANTSNIYLHSKTPVSKRFVRASHQLLTRTNRTQSRRGATATPLKRAGRTGGLNALALRSARSPRRGPTRPQRSPTAYTGPSTTAAPIRPAPSAARPAPPRPAAHARHIRRRGPGPPCGGSRGVTEMLVGRCPFGIRSQHFLILMMP